MEKVKNKFSLGELSDLFVNHVSRKINGYMKSQIFLLEDIAYNYGIEGEDYQRFRKKILDQGNDIIRDFEGEFDNFLNLITRG